MEALPQKPGRDGIQKENWFAGSISERKAEKILTAKGVTGGFLVRSSLLPDADYVLSVNSGDEIWHYDIKYLSGNECIFNKYSFPGIYEVIKFYSDNRLGKVYLELPEEPIMSEPEVSQVSSQLHIKLAPKMMKPLVPRSRRISEGAGGQDEEEEEDEGTPKLSGELEPTDSKIQADGEPGDEIVPAIASTDDSGGAEVKLSSSEAPHVSTCEELTEQAIPSMDDRIQRQTRVDTTNGVGQEGIQGIMKTDDTEDRPQSEKSESADQRGEGARKDPATIIRQRSRAEILVELKDLPSIGQTKMVIAKKIQGRDNGDEDSGDGQEEREVTKPPPSTPPTNRTTPLFQPSNEQHIPEDLTTCEIATSAGTTVQNPPISGDLPSLSGMKTGNSPPSPKSSPQPPPAKSQPPKVPQKPAVLKRQRTGEKLAQVEGSVTYQPAMSTNDHPAMSTNDHPVVKDNKDSLTQCPAKGEDSETIPQAEPPSIPAASSRTETPYKPAVNKPSPLPRRKKNSGEIEGNKVGSIIDSSQSEGNGATVEDSKSASSNKPEKLVSPGLSPLAPPNGSSDITSAITDTVSSPSYQTPPRTSPTTSSSRALLPTVAVSSNVANSSSATTSSPGSQTPPIPQTPPISVTLSIASTSQTVEAATTSPVSSPTSQIAQRGSMAQYPFLFPHASTKEGGQSWGSGNLTVSTPTNVESIIKCGPMNTKRGGTIKKKSIIRRK